MTQPDMGMSAHGMIRQQWLRFYDKPPKGMRVVQSWDTCIGAGYHHSASACLTIGEHKGEYYLIDSETFRLGYPELKQKVYDMAKKFNPQAILIEDRASGQQLLQDLRRESSMPLVACREMKRHKDAKIERFAALSCFMESGKLFLPHRVHPEFVQELLEIPYGNHDDQVDATTQALLAWTIPPETKTILIYDDPVRISPV